MMLRPSGRHFEDRDQPALVSLHSSLLADRRSLLTRLNVSRRALKRQAPPSPLRLRVILDVGTKSAPRPVCPRDRLCSWLENERDQGHRTGHSRMQHRLAYSSAWRLCDIYCHASCVLLRCSASEASRFQRRLNDRLGVIARRCPWCWRRQLGNGQSGGLECRGNDVAGIER